MIMIKAKDGQSFEFDPPMEPFYQDWRFWTTSPWLWRFFIEFGQRHTTGNFVVYNRDDYRGGDWELVGGCVAR